ncbi:HDOD domain-containing protein [Colwellia hornerae]|uniref:HDOD domain-containing protein n=1 Tax=Colwellia hornerae TaxID=89402 RepID=A0A5C6QD92_9GAMM|nr:HDOD domain-containing protein [Colwellia hornerae]TWX51695.1 HDOD domain-containing protein [Colwellia hornerae]TWX57483.1 HDOD domain-containing protein [Colwellia hornerae]TWX66986.1 HDOD domain-containing protein [Colwellia hornerae]
MKVLIVDNTEQTLLALKQAFYNGPCQTAYVNNGKHALKALQQYKFDAIISVLNLGKISGLDLLKAIALKQPAMIRVAITHDSITDSQTASHCHYSYALPLNVEDIHQTITALGDDNKAITKDHIIKVVAKVKTLPSPPKVYLQLNAILEESNTDSEKISEIISQDPALAAKVLQFSNSSLMNQGKPINDISEAITRMGLETLCCIVMTAELFSYEPNITDFSLIKEQLHCLSTARLAASMVKAELKRDALLAGLLHDIGKIVLFEMDPELTKTYFKYRLKSANNNALEQKVFGTDHNHVGGYLLHMWSFSYHLIEAVVMHHRPEKLLKKSFGIAQAVYLADILLREQQPEPTFIEHFKLENVLEALEKRAAKLRQ